MGKAIRFRSSRKRKKEAGNHDSSQEAAHEKPHGCDRKKSSALTKLSIPQHSLQNPARLKEFDKKKPNAPKHYLEGSAKNLLLSYRRTSGKMCRHNLTRYIPAVTEANNLFNFGRFSRYSLKYTVFNQHGNSPCRIAGYTAFFSIYTLNRRLSREKFQIHEIL